MAPLQMCLFLRNNQKCARPESRQSFQPNCMCLRISTSTFPVQEYLKYHSIWEIKSLVIIFSLMSCDVFQSIQLHSNIFSLCKIKVSEDRDKVILNKLDSKRSLSVPVWAAFYGGPLSVPLSVGEIVFLLIVPYTFHALHFKTRT